MRQPVKGKPHIVPRFRKNWSDESGRASNFEFGGLGDRRADHPHILVWGYRVEASWDRWWRQHQEAA